MKSRSSDGGHPTLQPLKIRTCLPRWIIDFKTSYHEGGSLEDFLDSEVARYRSQLSRYAEVLSKLDSRPIRMALYFPIFKVFRDWANKEDVINN